MMRSSPEAIAYTIAASIVLACVATMVVAILWRRPKP